MQIVIVFFELVKIVNGCESNLNTLSLGKTV